MISPFRATRLYLISVSQLQLQFPRDYCAPNTQVFAQNRSPAVSIFTTSNLIHFSPARPPKWVLGAPWQFSREVMTNRSYRNDRPRQSISQWHCCQDINTASPATTFRRIFLAQVWLHRRPVAIQLSEHLSMISLRTRLCHHYICQDKLRAGKWLRWSCWKQLYMIPSPTSVYNNHS
jgi:hypothetical protein